MNMNNVQRSRCRLKSVIRLLPVMLILAEAFNPPAMAAGPPRPRLEGN